MKKFKYAEIYTGSKKGQTPSIDKDWNVYYFFLIPGSKPERYRRFVTRGGINRFHTIDERMNYAKRLVRVIDRELDNGFNPFEEIEDRAFLSFGNAVKWSLSRQEWSPETRKLMEYMVNVFLNTMGGLVNKDVKSFTRIQARETLEKIVKDRKLGNLAHNRYRAVMRRVFSELVEWEKIPFNPFEFRNKKVPPKKKKALATPEEVELIREYLEIKNPYLLTFVMAVNMTFIRLSELLKLKAEDVDIQKWRITVRAEISKNRKQRTVVVPFDLRERLLLHVLPDHYLFGGGCKPEIREKPLDYTTIWHKWDNLVVRDLGIKVTPYSFKHMGTRKMTAKIDRTAAQYQAGHSSSAMTDIYNENDVTIYEDQLENFPGDF